MKKYKLLRNVSRIIADILQCLCILLLSLLFLNFSPLNSSRTIYLVKHFRPSLYYFSEGFIFSSKKSDILASSNHADKNNSKVNLTNISVEQHNFLHLLQDTIKTFFSGAGEMVLQCLFCWLCKDTCRALGLSST